MFIGESGSRKSTLAFALARLGWTMLGDDVVVTTVTQHLDQTFLPSFCSRAPYMDGMIVKRTWRERFSPIGRSLRCG
jgi:ABC-type dipeptide/oligopeptide/nickel transport system ATPase subunit